MTLAKRIYDILVKEGRPMEVKEIANRIEDKPATTVRGRIYTNMGKLFKKIARGVYWVENEDAAVVVVEGSGRDMTMIEDNSVSAIITDHPYLTPESHKGGNRDFTSDYECFRYNLEDFKEKARVLKDGAFLVEMLPTENADNYEYLYQIKQMAKEAGFEYYSKLPWKKGNFVANTGRCSKNTEDLVFFTKGKARALRPNAKKEGSFMSGTATMLPTCFDYQPPTRRERLHQAEKPSLLYQAILEAITLPGELVIDQFAGAGGLGEAALNKGRFAILFEILKENVDKIVKRLGAVRLEVEEPILEKRRIIKSEPIPLF